MSIHKIEEGKPTSEFVAKINSVKLTLGVYTFILFLFTPHWGCCELLATFYKTIWQCIKKFKVVTQKTLPLGIYLQWKKQANKKAICGHTLVQNDLKLGPTGKQHECTTAGQ